MQTVELYSIQWLAVYHDPLTLLSEDYNQWGPLLSSNVDDIVVCGHTFKSVYSFIYSFYKKKHFCKPHFDSVWSHSGIFHSGNRSNYTCSRFPLQVTRMLWPENSSTAWKTAASCATWDTPTPRSMWWVMRDTNHGLHLCWLLCFDVYFQMPFSIITGSQ